jgi:hypothetical protein
MPLNNPKDDDLRYVFQVAPTETITQAGIQRLMVSILRGY